MTTPVENLSQDQFKIEDRVSLFGRPVALIMAGFWSEDGAEAMVGVLAVEPMDFCRVSAVVHYTPGEPLAVGRVTEPDDPRDDVGVLERFFEQPLDQILAAIFAPLADAFAAAAEIREERAGDADEMPVREMPAPAWVHQGGARSVAVAAAASPTSIEAIAGSFYEVDPGGEGDGPELSLAGVAGDAPRCSPFVQPDKKTSTQVMQPAMPATCKYTGASCVINLMVSGASGATRRNRNTGALVPLMPPATASRDQNLPRARFLPIWNTAKRVPETTIQVCSSITVVGQKPPTNSCIICYDVPKNPGF